MCSMVAPHRCHARSMSMAEGHRGHLLTAPLATAWQVPRRCEPYVVTVLFAVLWLTAASGATMLNQTAKASMLRVRQALNTQRQFPRRSLALSANDSDIEILGSLPGVCNSYGLTYNIGSISSSTTVRRVFDCFLASNELDMMEIRMRELEHVVDAFVVVESRMTFRGKPKKLSVPRLLSRLPGTVLAKMSYHVLDTLQGHDAWEREKFQRDALFGVGLLRLQPRPGDVLIASDCDEIPKPAFLLALKYCDGVSFPLSMQSLLHYYSFSLMSSNVDKVWNHPHATLYSKPFTQSAQKLRLDSSAKVYANSSWTCSTCFNHVLAVREKLSSFSHSELDIPDNHNLTNIIARVRTGVDLYNRPHMQFVKDESGDMPKYIKQHPTRFSYLMSRETADAGFKDLGMPAAT